MKAGCKMNTTKKVVFLFGGPGTEHEVSVATAKSALPNFAADYTLLPVFISKENKWVVANNYVSPGEAWATAQKLMTQSGLPNDIALDEIEKNDPYVVFIGLHGTFGEDGTVQTLLEARGLTFTGSDAEASALAIDKPKVLQILQDENILAPEFLELDHFTQESEILDFVHFHGLPVVTLPADNGSSVGVTIVKNENDLQSAIKHASHYGERVLLTKYIAGREVSCGALITNKTDLTALPPTELIPVKGHDFFDYDAKYTPGATQEITPPKDMDDDVVLQIQTIAKKVHHILSADGYSRTDMIIDKDNKIYVLELNTLPGLTQTSILPQQARAYGLSFTELLTTLCENADRSAKDYITATP
jgi:D-alanine-D-alanine ligase